MELCEPTVWANAGGSQRDAPLPDSERQPPQWYSGIELHPEMRPISLAQLVNEVKGIYVGLVMLESECIEIDSEQGMGGKTRVLTDKQWQGLITLHRTILRKHCGFLQVLQHMLQTGENNDLDNTTTDTPFHLLEEIERLFDWLIYRFEKYLQQHIYVLLFFFFFSEFPDGIRHLCTTMPWTIWPALAVLWGVCWMFYSEARMSGDVQEDASQMLPDSWDTNDLSLFYDDPAIHAAAQEHAGSFADTGLDASTLLVANPSTLMVDPAILFMASSTPNMLEATFAQPGPDRLPASSTPPRSTQPSRTCQSCSKVFARADVLKRHMREIHGETVNSYDKTTEYLCPTPGCKRSKKGAGFKRRNKLQLHMDNSCKPRRRAAVDDDPLVPAPQQNDFPSADSGNVGNKDIIAYLEGEYRKKKGELDHLQGVIEMLKKSETPR